jgi:hypothetical protein
VTVQRRLTLSACVAFWCAAARGQDHGAAGAPPPSEVPGNPERPPAAVGPEPAGEAANDAGDASPFQVNGEFDQRYRFRKAGSASDQDLFGYLTLNGEAPAPAAATWKAAPLFRFTIEGSYELDIDSFPHTRDTAGTDFYPFFDVYNTYDHRLHALLHAAYIESSQLTPFETVRLGRQTIYRDAALLFDGGFVRTRPWNGISFNAYGGVPAHLYESSPAGDALGGGGIEVEPLRSLTLGADYVFDRDARQDFPDGEDNIWRLYGQYRFLRDWDVKASGSWNGSHDRRQTFDLRYLSPDIGFLGSFRAIRQSDLVEFETSEFSPYLIVMGEYQPFYQFQLDLNQDITKNFDAGAGFTIRDLADDGDAGQYNHSFQNYYLSLEAKELWPGMRASIRGDLWYSDGDDMNSAGFEVEQKLVEVVRIRAGTSYTLYRIDLFTGKERVQDRMYFVEGRWRATKHLEFETEYRYEKDSETEYHTVIGAVRLWF